MNSVIGILLAILAGFGGIFVMGGLVLLVGKLVGALKVEEVDDDWDWDYEEDFEDGLSDAVRGGSAFVPPRM